MTNNSATKERPILFSAIAIGLIRDTLKRDRSNTWAAILNAINERIKL